MATIETDVVDTFIAKWQGVTASELSTSQSFLLDLCQLLGVDAPHATPEQDYMFERPIKFAHGDGSSSDGRIDLYKRGAFVLESKKLKAATHSKGFDDALLRARSQAEGYARALPASEGRPPFVLVVDVGNRIELYSEFSRSGATYTPFPDPRSHRIALADLRNPLLLDRLRRIWTDPLSLDPSRESARVTREIADRLARLARSLEQRTDDRPGHAPELVAQFLMRCLFTMFAEDVKLLPHDSFRDLLIKHAEQPDVAMRMLGQLWRDMDSGGFSAAIASDVLRFNGKLFKTPDTLPLDSAQIGLLVEAARAKWEHVEPAIFGTLLERALSPGERHKLGAHYTPRAYVERLVLPTVIEPLRMEWSDAQAAALTLAAEGRPDEAVAELRRFHHRLCTVRVLDPACGSGNFLYVTLEHLKRLEGEVLNALDELGDRQTGLALGGERADTAGGETVDPHQLLGIELNPRAAAIAEVVLWIGYLQWHFRTRGDVSPPTPVIRDFRNIENRDAVLAYDRMEYVTDERCVPVTRWDGRTMKKSPITGEDVPDDSARVPVERYVNPRKAAWPDADFVVGNPPFIGNKRMRNALGDGYVEALRGVWPDVPETSDFVMYWWHHAAVLTQHGALQRFGFITTNSISQTFNRRVIEAAMQPPRAVALRPFPRLRGKAGMGGSPEPASGQTSAPAPPPQPSPASGGGSEAQALSLVFAIPDHPWVDSGEGAAVRISMTVAARSRAGMVGQIRSGDPVAGPAAGRFLTVMSEATTKEGEVDVALSERHGLIHADLSAGANVVAAVKLQANTGVCFQGMNLVGKGFRLEPAEVLELGYDLDNLPDVIQPHCNARDLMQGGEHCYVIDLFGLTAEQARAQHPALYQRLFDRVKPEREHNNRASYRERWWQFGEARGKLRASWEGLSCLIITAETAKHRVFSFVDRPFCPDHKLYAICLDDASWHGVLSSEIHKRWALSAGGRLGVGNDPTWTNTTCFATFPFPDLHAADKFTGPLAYSMEQADGRSTEFTTVDEYPSDRIRTLADHLDAHRKRQQSAHPDLTLTGMYNVLDKLRSGEVLSAKERIIHEHGLVSVLRQLHDELDAAVLDAYGWSDLLPLLRIAHGNDAVVLLPSGEGAQRADEGGRVTDQGMVTASGESTPSSGAARHPQPPDAASIPAGEGKAQAKRAFDDAILERLVALNAERAAEEARGLVRWLRPEFQNPRAAAPEQVGLAVDAAQQTEAGEGTSLVAFKPKPWPKDTVEQVRAVADTLAASQLPLTLDDIARHFTGKGPWKKRLPQLLDMLVALGRAHVQGNQYVGGR